MPGDGITLREAKAADLPGIFHVRTSVAENLLTVEQLRSRGITEASVAASLSADAKGWVAECEGRNVGFSIADRASRSIFALFVLPQYEGRGLGERLLELALRWLWDNGADAVWLTTGPETKAARFYERRGWVCVGKQDGGDMRYELSRPPAPGTLR